LNLLIFGFGYCGRAIALAARDAGFKVTVTSRDPTALKPEQNIQIIAFAAAAPAIAAATHILATAAPDDNGDPVLSRYGADITAAKSLSYIGYLSTTGVYGNRDGGWVDETTPPAPQSPRAQRRVDAEAAWSKYQNIAVDIFRLAGIYGPGRSMFDDLRTCTARRVVKPGHLFGRIHRDDIAQGVLAALRQNPLPGTRIFNFTDDEPAASADVVVEAARLLGVAPPAPIAFADAAPKMSPMGLSFWAENRRVANAKTKATLGIRWQYPTYRDGLRAILNDSDHAASGSHDLP
jgi:nucleoside-diphosphate-sugar epimerase